MCVCVCVCVLCVSVCVSVVFFCVYMFQIRVLHQPCVVSGISASSVEGEFLLGQPVILWRWKTLRRQSAKEFACWVYAPSSFSVSETASRLVFGTMANNPDDIDVLNSDDDKMGDVMMMITFIITLGEIM